MILNLSILLTLPLLGSITVANGSGTSSFDVTSRTKSLDEWLFSEDLFPGHVIPKDTHHTDALKIFTRILDDVHILAEAHEKYRVQHNKVAEEDDVLKLETRRAHFRENLHLIFSHNLQADVGNSRYQLGVNMFADMSKEELRTFLGARDDLNFPIHPKEDPSVSKGGGPPSPPSGPQMGPPAQFPGASTQPFPISFDLRDEQVVSPIKNQRKCGSCVFFSFAGLLETLYALKHSGAIVNLSEQMMLDCATPDNGYVTNRGCEGNFMEETGQYLMDHGVTTEENYKYEAKQGNCSLDMPIVARLKDFWQVPPTPEAFKHTLVNEKQPIATAYLVYHTFMFYRTGVFDQCTPPNGAIGGHAVVITGYGTFIDTGYWVVKNSWGVKWGEAGYFRYAIGEQFCRFERWGFTGTLV